METLKFEIESTATGRVDAEKGIIEGVSVISTPEAKGHNIKIDRASIESFAAAVEGKQIKAYYTHSPSNEALDSIGLWQNFEIKEEEEYTKLTADFVALESWKEHDPKNYDALFELAKKAPEAFGVSAEFQAKTIFYNEEGEEVEFSGEEEGKELFARAVEVSAFSIVASPAANPTGLFSVGAAVLEDVEERVQLAEQNRSLEVDLKASQIALEEITKKHEDLEKQLDEKEKQLEEAQQGMKDWAAKYAQAIVDAGAEPVDMVQEEQPKSFSEKLALCKNNDERQDLIKSNMNYLIANWQQIN